MSENAEGGAAVSKKSRAKRAPKAKPAKKAARKKAEGVTKLVNPNLEQYKVTKDVKTGSGRPAVDSDDNVARRLRGSDLDAVYREASKATGVPMTQLKTKYEKLNIGMQRMNLGNLIRGAASKEKRAPKAKAA